VARVDFQDDVKGSLLLEPQSTNLITQSESFGNSYWTKSGASIEGDPSTAGALVSSSDFSVGVDGYETARTVMSGNIDGILGVNDVLRFYANADANTHYVRAINKLIGNSLTYVTFDYYIPTSNTNVDGFNLLSGIGAFTSNNESFGVTGSWISASGFALGTSSTIQFRMTSGGNTSFSGANLITDDLVYLKNIVVREAVGFASPSLDSPTGAFKLVESSSNSSHRVQSNFTSVDSTDYTLSVFAKKVERNYISLQINPKSNAYISTIFNLDNGTIVGQSAGASAPISSKIKYIGNGFYKCEITVNSSTGSGTTNVRVFVSDNPTNITYQGDGTSGVYIYGAQLEALPYATSYIPTSGSAVTRVQDYFHNFGDVNTFNSEEGVLSIEMAALGEGFNRYISLSDGTNTNRLILRYTSSNASISTYVVVGGNVITYISSTVSDITKSSKVAFSYKENNYSLYINGVKVAEQLSGITFPPNTLNKLSFANSNGSYFSFFGKVKELQVYKESLTDSELITLTTI